VPVSESLYPIRPSGMTPFAATTDPPSAVTMPFTSNAFATALRTFGSLSGPEAVFRSATRFWKEGVSTTWRSGLPFRLVISCGVRRSTYDTSPDWASCAAVVTSGTTRKTTFV
jgi:hypothetical protein